MSEPIAQQSSDSLKHAGHETTDASAFYVGLFALGLLLTICAISVVVEPNVLAVRGLSRTGRSYCEPGGRQSDTIRAADFRPNPVPIW